jgi:hypothetical protein
MNKINDEKTRATAVVLPIEMVQEEAQPNRFSAFSVSSMMMLVKKDLFGSGEMSSSPAAPGGW